VRERERERERRERIYIERAHRFADMFDLFSAPGGRVKRSLSLGCPDRRHTLPTFAAGWRCQGEPRVLTIELQKLAHRALHVCFFTHIAFVMVLKAVLCACSNLLDAQV